MQNPSDHFLRMINKDFDRNTEGGGDGRRPTEEAIEILSNSYKSSNTCQQVLTQVDEICKQGGGAIMEKKRRHANFVNQCVVLTKRSFVNMYRDFCYYWLRVAIYILLAIGIGTTYFHLGSSYDSVEPKVSMLTFIAGFLTFMAIGGFPSFVEDMKVFQLERLNGHYGVGAFIIGNTFSSLPYLLLLSLIPGLVSSFLTGLQDDFQHLTYYNLLFFTCMVLVESLMMIIASIVPNFLMGIISGAGIQGLMILSGGIFRKPNSLPKPFWYYPMHNIAFHRYAFQGLCKNELEGTTYHVLQDGKNQTITGEYILRNTWQVNMGYSKWVDLAILLGMVVLYRVLFFVIIKCTEMFKPTIRAFTALASRKQKKQIMGNPNASPLHEATIEV